MTHKRVLAIFAAGAVGLTCFSVQLWAQADGHISIGEGRNWSQLNPPHVCRMVKVRRNHHTTWIERCNNDYPYNATGVSPYAGPYIGHVPDGSSGN